MTATDIIRALLDKHGVEWIGTSHTKPTQGHPTNTSFDEEHNNAVFIEYFDGNVLRLFDITPEQAVDAMLGRETCKLERHGSLADQPNMVCWSCSECGFGWHHSVNDKQFSYCPNCGRKVVS